MLHTLACFACISFMRLKTSTNAVEITILPVPAVRIIGTIERLRHRIKLMIARGVGLNIPKKLTNKVYPSSRGEWKHIRFESRVAGGGWWI
jgi:hypothetical protein